MRQNNHSVLDRAATPVKDAHRTILEMAHGGRVLNVGAAGNASYYRDHGMNDWLHARLSTVAQKAVGLDLDGAEVHVAQALGFDVRHGDCETIHLDENFDLIVLADVVEHLDNPARALTNLAHCLAVDGHIVMTTPNATFLGNVVNALLRRPPKVFWDHVNLYTPENIQALCDRHGWTLLRTYFYSQFDQRSFPVHVKSWLVSLVGAMFPRLHGAFMCVMTPTGEAHMHKDRD